MNIFNSYKMPKHISEIKTETPYPEYTPCIVSKAKLALGLPNRCRGNIKIFTKDYWEMVIYYLAKINNVKSEIVNNAITHYEYDLNLKHVKSKK